MARQEILTRFKLHHHPGEGDEAGDELCPVVSSVVHPFEKRMVFFRNNEILHEENTGNSRDESGGLSSLEYVTITTPDSN